MLAGLKYKIRKKGKLAFLRVLLSFGWRAMKGFYNSADKLSPHQVEINCSKVFE